ncbi:response regulator transcription factor [Treponema sp. Marseille-Q4130]|uniref:response regulator transcription factor n=1 Tax=Treponema TaxID=157 RepID=UPI002107B2BD|nr:response regulator transcription factor [Treponema sp. Marseille-Q4130]
MLQNKNPSLSITGAGTIPEAVKKLNKDKDIKIVILDLNLDGENSLESVSKIKKANPDILILIYTMYNDDIHAENALLLGVQGFITKEASVDEVEKAILAVGSGNTYYNRAASKVLYALLPQNKGKHIVRDEKSYLFDNYKSLSKKEQEVFIHLAQGLDIVEIAARLGKSKKTILNQRTAVYGKMFIRDRHDLIEKAKFLGLIF